MLFILGIERSATTWLSNVIEAHPVTRVYVEPMSSVTARFKDWPDRFQPITDVQVKAHYFCSEFEIAKKHRYWLLTKWMQTPLTWRFDLWLSNFLVRKKIASEHARDFSEINFHRKNQLHVAKENAAQLEVIKELRLNFNAQLIPVIDPDTRVVVVIRNMYANIRSVLTHIEQGSLAELKPLLLRKYGEISGRTVYKYWLDSYENLLRDLDRSATPYFVLNHTELLKHPEEQIKAMCAFAGLDNPEIMLDYFYSSNKEGSGIHNTYRSHADLLDRNRGAKEEILPKIQGLVERSELHPRLRILIDEM